MSMFSVLSFLIADCNSTIAKVEPCFTDRKVSAELSEERLACISTGDLVLLSRDSDNVRYSICNPDSHTFVKGEFYTIDGKVYEVKPNERWPGTPLQITKVKK